MTDIIKMALEAGLIPPPLDWPQKYAEMLERFAALVRADEREQCAEMCDELVENRPMTVAGKLIAQECAAAIRSNT